MATGYIDKKIIVTMNPKELRDLADKMEDKFPQLQVGDSTFVGFLVYSKALQIDLHLDQEWFHQRNKKR